MNHQEKAKIREIQEAITQIAYVGSEHTPAEVKALEEALWRWRKPSRRPRR